MHEDRIREYQEGMENYTLMDDEYMSVYFFNNNECTEVVLGIILENEDLNVINTDVQYGIHGLTSRGVRLDVLATDSQGKKYNIEVQKAESGASPRRARYNSSMLDYSSTVKGSKYDDIVDTFVIFITETDILGGNKDVYHIDRTIKEMGTDFMDGSHILYVNTQIQDNTALGRLVHDLKCSSPDEMYYRKLAERARVVKQRDRGGAEMGALFEKWHDEMEDEFEEKERKLKADLAEKERRLKEEADLAGKERKLREEAEERARKLKEEATEARKEAKLTEGLSDKERRMVVEYIEQVRSCQMRQGR